MPTTQDWLDAVRTSNDQFAGLVRPLAAEEVERPAYPSEWSIADTASHLGSQSEIMGMMLEAGLTGGAPPEMDRFQAVWNEWNALPPAEQVRRSIAANQAFVDRLTQTTTEQREAFSVPLFGSDGDLGQLAAMRLGEHAVHTWDIAAALNPAAQVAPEAVALLIDRLPGMAGRAGQPVADQEPVIVRTTDPERTFRVTLGPEVSVEATDDPGSAPLVVPAEAFLRLVHGRLDPDHTPAGADESRLAPLRPAFPGF